MWKRMAMSEDARESLQHEFKPPYPCPTLRRVRTVRQRRPAAGDPDLALALLAQEARGTASRGSLLLGGSLGFITALLIGSMSEVIAQESKQDGKKTANVTEKSEQSDEPVKKTPVVEKDAAEESASAQATKKSAAAAKAMEAAEQFQKSLAEWRKELGPKGKIDAETAEALQGKLRAIGGELRYLMMAAQRQTSKAPATTPPPIAPVASKVKQWVTEIRALGPGAEERRAAGLEAVKKALTDKDPATQLAALRALTETGDIVYDRTPYRPIVLSIVETARGPTLMAALYALYNVGRQPGDLAIVQAAYERDPKALEPSISHLLFSFSSGLIEGKSEKIILNLLASDDRNTVRETLRGLWGAIVTPKLADRLIELADQPATHHEAIYYGLSTLKQKNEAVIDKLIETLSDPDWVNDGQRALWGLGYGIPKDHQLKVAAALVELHNSRSDARTRRTCEDLVQRYGGDVMAAKLVRE